MSYFSTNPSANAFKNTNKFNDSEFLDILSSKELSMMIERHTPEHRERIFTPSKTLSMFIKQALNSDRSCSRAVNDFIVDNVDSLPKNIGRSTESFCRSRQKLPLDLITELVRLTGKLVKDKINNQHKIEGNIYLIDGTTFTLPDTIKNQEKYPQQSTQKEGLGFPICRALGVHCLESGAVINAKIAPYKGKGADEHSMLRAILNTFEKGDLVIGDALYSSYWLLAYLQQNGINGVFQKNGGRAQKTDFRVGIKLAKNDHVVTYSRPQRPSWKSIEQYELAPKTIEIRELKVKHKIIVTTLLQEKTYSKNDISDLYKSRWNIEVDFRDLKTTLGMSELSCKSPEMCEKEIWIYFLANNLIRILMAQTAKIFSLKIRSVSFKNTLQIWNTVSSKFKDTVSAVKRFFFLIAGHQVGKRPGRVEPRARKRRASAFSLLMMPRHLAKARILKNGHPPKQRKNTGANGGKA